MCLKAHPFVFETCDLFAFFNLFLLKMPLLGL